MGMCIVMCYSCMQRFLSFSLENQKSSPEQDDVKLLLMSPVSSQDWVAVLVTFHSVLRQNTSHSKFYFAQSITGQPQGRMAWQRGVTEEKQFTAGGRQNKQGTGQASLPFCCNQAARIRAMPNQAVD